MFGLPDEVRACLFDMDGVVTQTARSRGGVEGDVRDSSAAPQTGSPFFPPPPSPPFLESRGIHLPEGTPDDPPGTPTLTG